MFGTGTARFMGGRGGVAPVMYILLSLLVTRGAANVVLIGKNVSLSFDDIESNFTPTIKGSGESGVLYLAEPLDACSPLTNKVVESTSSFALIIRGGCMFDDKVQSAQAAGFKAAIVYNNVDTGALVPMAGSPVGIKIHAVFVSKASGEVLKKYGGRTDVELWIIPTFENSAWSIMAISFISLLAMSAVLATCFFVRRHRVRRERPRAHVREFHGMGSQLVKAMPSLIFTSVLEDNCTSRTCAICLEDYNVGEKLRILPCRHKFHAYCVDAWLTTWRTFCPVCKRDASTSTADPPASEFTPLLLSVPASPSSSAVLSSFHSSGSPSRAIQIFPSPARSLSASRTHSHSSIPHPPNSQRSYYNSPAASVSRSSADQRNLSSHRSSASHLMSSHSLGFPPSSPINSRYASPYIHGSSIGSPSYLVGSSSRRQSSLYDSSSAASLCALASAQSLPEC
uniref:E3 ubiquitin-protein ligase RNF167 n=1 Tax=Anthurium amnicola TaxID=1678845 RepID=A0A1D1YRT3_9ARAE